MTTPPHIDLHRNFPATPEEVWQRWTTEEGLATWWWTQFPDTTYQIDCTPGGTWRIATAAAGFAVSGIYDVVEAPRRLSFTWIWTDADGDGPTEHVEIIFTPQGSATRLDLTHTGPWGHEQAENYLVGWNDTLDSLSKALHRS